MEQLVEERLRPWSNRPLGFPSTEAFFSVNRFSVNSAPACFYTSFPWCPFLQSSPLLTVSEVYKQLLLFTAPNLVQTHNQDVSCNENKQDNFIRNQRKVFLCGDGNEITAHDQRGLNLHGTLGRKKSIIIMRTRWSVSSFFFMYVLVNWDTEAHILMHIYIYMYIIFSFPEFFLCSS